MDCADCQPLSCYSVSIQKNAIISQTYNELDEKRVCFSKRGELDILRFLLGLPYSLKY